MDWCRRSTLSACRISPAPPTGDEVRILHLPSLRFDVLDEPLHTSPLYWRMGSSLSYLGRSEPSFHARNMGRFDLYPHLSLPLVAGGWSLVPEVALRETFLYRQPGS